TANAQYLRFVRSQKSLKFTNDHLRWGKYSFVAHALHLLNAALSWTVHVPRRTSQWRRPPAFDPGHGVRASPRRVRTSTPSLSVSLLPLRIVSRALAGGGSYIGPSRSLRASAELSSGSCCLPLGCRHPSPRLLYRCCTALMQPLRIPLSVLDLS